VNKKKSVPDSEQYGIFGEFQHWEGDPAEDWIGPFFFRMEEESPITAFRIRSEHCNAHGTLHGGIMMAFTDYTLCLGANRGSNEQSVVTVTCNNEFVAPAADGELVEGRGDVIKRGRSLVFLRSTLSVGKRVILVSSGVVKLIKP
jgi:uncharacterized protein (TIGR00369 family)